MELEEIIKEKRLIDVNLFSSQEVSYTGVCLKANKNIWILVNYDFKKKAFNGFTVFRNNIVETFSLWKKTAIVLKRNNLTEFTDFHPLTNAKTLYSSLKWGKKFGLVAIFTETNTRSYFVGKIILLNPRCIILRLITTEGKWSIKKTINLKEIYFISFYTDYEIILLQKSNKIPSPPKP